jgi:hypothetical protein
MAAAELPPIPTRYAKALCHLNHARRTQRLGLILGSGVSDSLRIPKWPQLIRALELQLGYEAGGAPESYRAEQLFQHYKKKRTTELGWESDERLRLDAAILAHHSMPSRYVYYIVGAVSSGKSTTLRNLRSLATIEEWPNQMPAVMNRPSVGLRRVQEAQIDKRLEDAIWIKNSELRSIKTGLVAVDRAPLDFIAFPTRATESLGVTARKRAKTVLGRLQTSGLRDLCPGQILLVQADTEILVERQLQRGRGRAKPQDVASGSSARYLNKQKERLSQIYSSAIAVGSVITTDRCSIETTAIATLKLLPARSKRTN